MVPFPSFKHQTTVLSLKVFLIFKISFSPKPKFQPSTGSDIDVNAYAAECAQRVQRVGLSCRPLIISVYQ